MTDTPTPPMTPEQRAHFCRLLNNARLGECANQLEADGVTIATLTAARDAAQAEIARLSKINVKLCADFNLMNQHGAKQDTEIARLTAALATAREDGMREGKSLHRIADFIDDQVKVTRETMRQASLGRNDMSLLEIGTSHFLDCARDIRKAAIQKGAAT